MNTLLLTSIFALQIPLQAFILPPTEPRGIIEQFAYVRASTGVVAPLVVDKTPIQELKVWVLNEVEKAGFSPALADTLITCESGWNPNAKHWNPPTPTRPGTWDVGLWQINDVHGMSVEERLDPYKNTGMAIQLLKSKRSWKHWVCFKG